MDEKELKKALSELGNEIDAKLEKHAKSLSEIDTKAKEAAMAEIKKQLEPQIENYKKMQEQLDAISTSLKRAETDKAKTETFTEAFKKFVKERLGDRKDIKKLKGSTFEYEVKEDMTQANSFESTIVVPVDQQPGIYYDPDRIVRVRDLISQGVTDSNMVTFIREYANTYSLTDVTTEGAEYKQVDFDLKRIDAAVIKITNYLIVSEEMLEDVNGLTSYIMARLPEKLRNEEDDQILNNATYGILTLGTAYSDNLADADISYIDILVDACRQIIDDEYRPTAILLHPTDITTLKLTKDDNGQYIFPWIFQANGNVVLDGVPVVVSTAITAGTFLVGDFKMGAQIFDRRQLAIEFSNTNEDNFIKGMVTVRGSERIAICVYRPKAFVYGNFVTAMARGSA